MARSQDEKGADKAVAIRKAQQKDRSRLGQEITESQKRISALNEERAPIAAEVRKVEAEVGPIKYIAAFIYGSSPDESMLERAVTWIIILIVIVFDPLAVIMLLASQMTFAWTREQKELNIAELDTFVGEKPTPEEIQIEEDTDLEPATIVEDNTEQHVPMTEDSELEKWNKMVEEAEKHIAVESTVEERVAKGETYINNEGAEVPAVEEAPAKTTLFSDILGAEEESKKKTYMTKDETGQIQVKNRV